MGTVALIARVMPESPEIDLVALTAEIRKQVPGLQDVKEEPIGFGLKALKIAVIADDAAGVSDEVEAKLNAIKGVERAEIIEVTLT
ncbi:elongation factor 1-beta [Methanolinea mesophila]|uniref:elongation factor 1-beta n=1 Tax=Methanolinea mesophila TaxID=547055 RepID=UPI001AE18BC0|nr:elongation factor 1-beta [Methanolinea mesophila]MBP1928573.1 elongation factor 1-beta [Methanolinea mesophila]